MLSRKCTVWFHGIFSYCCTDKQRSKSSDGKIAVTVKLKPCNKNNYLNDAKKGPVELSDDANSPYYKLLFDPLL